MDQSIMPSGDAERWLPAVDWEGYYEISDLGRLRSVRRMIPHGRWPGQFRQTGGRAVTPMVGTGEGRTWRRYTRFNLWRDGKMRAFPAHILVARAFLGPCPEGMEVCHGLGGPLDNRLVNLSYGTHSKNMGDDRRRDGTLPFGTDTPRAKLNDQIVLECRARAAAGESIPALASEFGITHPSMWRVVTGQTWRHLPVTLLPRCKAAAKQPATPARVAAPVSAPIATVADGEDEVASRVFRGVKVFEGVRMRFPRRPAA